VVPTGAFLAGGDGAATAALAAAAALKDAASGLSGCREDVGGLQVAAAAVVAAEGAILHKVKAVVKTNGPGRGCNGGAHGRGLGRPPKPPIASGGVGSRCDQGMVTAQAAPADELRLEQQQPQPALLEGAVFQETISQAALGEQQHFDCKLSKQHQGQQQLQQEQDRASGDEDAARCDSLAEVSVDAHVWVTPSAATLADAARLVSEKLVFNGGAGGHSQAAHSLLGQNSCLNAVPQDLQSGAREGDAGQLGDLFGGVQWWDLAPVRAGTSAAATQQDSCQQHNSLAAVALAEGPASDRAAVLATATETGAASGDWAGLKYGDNAGGVGTCAANAGPAGDHAAAPIAIEAAAEMPPGLVVAVAAAVGDDTPFLSVQELPQQKEQGNKGFSCQAAGGSDTLTPAFQQAMDPRMQQQEKPTGLQAGSILADNSCNDIAAPPAAPRQAQASGVSKRKRALPVKSSLKDISSDSDDGCSPNEDTDLDEDPEALPGFCRKNASQSGTVPAETSSTRLDRLAGNAGSMDKTKEGPCVMPVIGAAVKVGGSSACCVASAALPGPGPADGSLQGARDGSLGGQVRVKGHQRKRARSQVCRLAPPVA
jgi:hypothetical protein